VESRQRCACAPFAVLIALHAGKPSRYTLPCAPRRRTCARGARVFAFTTRPSLRTKEPNLNPPGGLRGDGLAGSLANQEQDGNNPTHMP
jgi:hypothetical protein